MAILVEMEGGIETPCLVVAFAAQPNRAAFAKGSDGTDARLASSGP